MSTGENVSRHTAYDDAFRTIEQECGDALIHFVNEIFGAHYGLNAEIVRLRNEHLIQEDGEGTKKRISDSHFMITDGDVTKHYHLECESKEYNGYILFRMFEYDIMHAKKEGTQDALTIEIPASGLLVLRDAGDPPEYMNFEIRTPAGSVNYKVPVIRMSDYTLENIFDKKMYFLIPFYFFNLEKQFDRYNVDQEELEMKLF